MKRSSLGISRTEIGVLIPRNFTVSANSLKLSFENPGLLELRGWLGSSTILSRLNNSGPLVFSSTL